MTTTAQYTNSALNSSIVMLAILDQSPDPCSRVTVVVVVVVSVVVIAVIIVVVAVVSL